MHMTPEKPGEEMRYRAILHNDDQLGPFPTQLLKHVSKPTNPIVGPIIRRDPGENVFSRSLRGDFGEQLQEEFRRMTRKNPLGAALVDLLEHLGTYRDKRNPVASSKAPLPDDPRVLSRHLQSLGYFMGADIIGIGKLPPSAVYTHSWKAGYPIEAPYKCAIVFVVRKADRSIRASNGWDYIIDPASFQAYQKVALQSEVVANYIRRLGHDAEASHAANYLTLMPQVLLEAGIGEVCRMGIVLNPFLGTNFKASCVLTNLELEIDGPIDFGLQEYCRGCKICATQCPAGAIPHGDQILYNGYYTWKLNSRACSDFCILNKEGSVCGRCTKVCPWHRQNTEPHDFADWDGNLAELHKEVDEQRARVIKHTFVDPTERTDKWWFKVEEVDGRLIVPAAKNPHKMCRKHPLA